MFSLWSADNLYRLTRLLAVLACLAMLLSPTAALAETEREVKYDLKADEADSTAIDVKLSFTMKKGEKAVLKPPGRSPRVAGESPAPKLEYVTQAESSYRIENLPDQETGWLLVAGTAGTVVFSYKARFTKDDCASGVAGESSRSLPAPRAIAQKDLKAFAASDVLMVPQNESGEYVSERFDLRIRTAEGEKALVPWPAAKEAGYRIESARELLDNYIAWGKLTLKTAGGSGWNITAAFTGDYEDVSDRKKAAYASDLARVYGELRSVLGPRPDQEAATVLVAGARRYGLSRPASSSLRDSLMIFHGGGKLEGEAAGAACKGWLDTWNGWSLIAAPGGGAAWIQEGLPWFYSFRLAGRLGLMDANLAYENFSAVYAGYLTDPLASTMSLLEAESEGDSGSLLRTKGACVLASMTVKLQQKVVGGSRNIEWFLGKLALKFDGLKGRRYTLVDVAEIVEDGTGSSWDGFFEYHVRDETPVLASEWSTTDILGSGGIVGGGTRNLETRGSKTNWIYLAIAILVIFAIPFILSPYVKRSIKLDVKMPRILPDWEEDSPAPGGGGASSGPREESAGVSETAPGGCEDDADS